jgi:endonuclease-8/formamidopyrimidine-DNA glycosylase
MPEGHTIHRIASDHRRLFAGGTVRARSPQGRFDAGARRLDGANLEGVDAHGKHLLYRFERDVTLHVHLGLVGSFRTHDAPAPTPSPATRLVLENDAGAAYLSGPMSCRLLDPREAAGIVQGLGPDPLGPGTRSTRFVEALAGDNRPIGTVLLDQGVVAGIGNVYRSEILFLEGIDPRRAASSLTPDEAVRIWSRAKEQLRRGVEDGRIITVDPKDVGAARRKDLPKQLRVYTYKRDHRPCLRCRTPITSTEMAGRRVWWCPTCQDVRNRNPEVVV